MRLVKGADIYSSRGEKLGTLDRVIIDPNTREVTHIVVEKGFLFTTNKVVSMDNVDPGAEGNITLRTSEQDLNKFQDFEESEYVSLDATDYPEGEGNVTPSYWYPPVNVAWWRTGMHMPYPAMPVYTLSTRQNIPEGTVAMQEGAKVVSRDDKHVGNIEQLIVDSEDNRVTHFVISEGLLFKERKLIPVLWISNIEENEVRLSVSSGTLERLPAHQNAG